MKDFKFLFCPQSLCFKFQQLLKWKIMTTALIVFKFKSYKCILSRDPKLLSSRTIMCFVLNSAQSQLNSHYFIIRMWKPAGWVGPFSVADTFHPKHEYELHNWYQALLVVILFVAFARAWWMIKSSSHDDILDMPPSSKIQQL